MEDGLDPGLRERDEDVRVVIVTGAGRGFSSGGEVGSEGVGGDLLSSAAQQIVANRNFLRHNVHRVAQAVATLQKPYIAMVNGAAVGAGMDMAAMADLRIASDRAKFGMLYVKVGIIPGDGGCYFLPKIVGMAKALELMWTGRIFDAEEAQRIGFVSRVVPQEELASETMQFARELASGPAVAIQVIKRLAYRSQTTGLAESLEMAEQAMLLVQSTEDSKRGAAGVQGKAGAGVSGAVRRHAARSSFDRLRMSGKAGVSGR